MTTTTSAQNIKDVLTLTIEGLQCMLQYRSSTQPALVLPPSSGIGINLSEALDAIEAAKLSGPSAQSSPNGRGKFHPPPAKVKVSPKQYVIGCARPHFELALQRKARLTSGGKGMLASTSIKATDVFIPVGGSKVATKQSTSHSAPSAPNPQQSNVFIPPDIDLGSVAGDLRNNSSPDVDEMFSRGGAMRIMGARSDATGKAANGRKGDGVFIDATTLALLIDRGFSTNDSVDRALAVIQSIFVEGVSEDEFATFVAPALTLSSSESVNKSLTSQLDINAAGSIDWVEFSGFFTRWELYNETVPVSKMRFVFSEGSAVGSEPRHRAPILKVLLTTSSPAQISPNPSLDRFCFTADSDGVVMMWETATMKYAQTIQAQRGVEVVSTDAESPQLIGSNYCTPITSKCKNWVRDMCFLQTGKLAVAQSTNLVTTYTVNPQSRPCINRRFRLGKGSNRHLISHLTEYEILLSSDYASDATALCSPNILAATAAAGASTKRDSGAGCVFLPSMDLLAIGMDSGVLELYDVSGIVRLPTNMGSGGVGDYGGYAQKPNNTAKATNSLGGNNADEGPRAADVLFPLLSYHPAHRAPILQIIDDPMHLRFGVLRDMTPKPTELLFLDYETLKPISSVSLASTINGTFVNRVSYDGETQMALGIACSRAVSVYSVALGTILGTLSDHSCPVIGGIVYPSKNLVYTVTEDRTIHVYDLRTYRKISHNNLSLTLPNQLEERLAAFAFDFGRDRPVAATSFPITLQEWNGGDEMDGEAMGTAAPLQHREDCLGTYEKDKLNAELLSPSCCGKEMSTVTVNNSTGELIMAEGRSVVVRKVTDILKSFVTGLNTNPTTGDGLFSSVNTGYFSSTFSGAEFYVNGSPDATLAATQVPVFGSSRFSRYDGRGGSINRLLLDKNGKRLAIVYPQCRIDIVSTPNFTTLATVDIPKVETFRKSLNMFTRETKEARRRRMRYDREAIATTETYTKPELVVDGPSAADQEREFNKGDDDILCAEFAFTDSGAPVIVVGTLHGHVKIYQHHEGGNRELFSETFACAVASITAVGSDRHQKLIVGLRFGTVYEYEMSFFRRKLLLNFQIAHPQLISPKPQNESDDDDEDQADKDFHKFCEVANSAMDRAIEAALVLDEHHLCILYGTGHVCVFRLSDAETVPVFSFATLLQKVTSATAMGYFGRDHLLAIGDVSGEVSLFDLSHYFDRLSAGLGAGPIPLFYSQTEWERERETAEVRNRQRVNTGGPVVSPNFSTSSAKLSTPLSSGSKKKVGICDLYSFVTYLGTIDAFSGALVSDITFSEALSPYFSGIDNKFPSDHASPLQSTTSEMASTRVAFLTPSSPTPSAASPSVGRSPLYTMIISFSETMSVMVFAMPCGVPLYLLAHPSRLRHEVFEPFSSAVSEIQAHGRRSVQKQFLKLGSQFSDPSSKLRPKDDLTSDRDEEDDWNIMSESWIKGPVPPVAPDELFKVGIPTTFTAKVLTKLNWKKSSTSHPFYAPLIKEAAHRKAMDTFQGAAANIATMATAVGNLQRPITNVHLTSDSALPVSTPTPATSISRGTVRNLLPTPPPEVKPVVVEALAPVDELSTSNSQSRSPETPTESLVRHVSRPQSARQPAALKKTGSVIGAPRPLSARLKEQSVSPSGQNAATEAPNKGQLNDWAGGGWQALLSKDSFASETPRRIIPSRPSSARQFIIKKVEEDSVARKSRQCTPPVSAICTPRPTSRRPSVNTSAPVTPKRNVDNARKLIPSKPESTFERSELAAALINNDVRNVAKRLKEVAASINGPQPKGRQINEIVDKLYPYASPARGSLPTTATPTKPPPPQREMVTPRNGFLKSSVYTSSANEGGEEINGDGLFPGEVSPPSTLADRIRENDHKKKPLICYTNRATGQKLQAKVVYESNKLYNAQPPQFKNPVPRPSTPEFPPRVWRFAIDGTSPLADLAAEHQCTIAPNPKSVNHRSSTGKPNSPWDPNSNPLQAHYRLHQEIQREESEAQSQRQSSVSFGADASSARAQFKRSSINQVYARIAPSPIAVEQLLFSPNTANKKKGLALSGK